jgi:broad specificity phosphatase PhoE
LSTIYMVRHGQASFGKENYDQLSQRGREQSRVLAEYLMRTGLSFDAVYAGDMVRQKDTAHEILSVYREHDRAAAELSVLSEFNEYSSRDIIIAHIHDVANEYPSLEADLKNIYTDKKAFQRVFEKIMMRWISGDADKAGVVRWQDFCGRVRSGLRRVMADNGRKKNILICTSGGPISAAVQMALGLSDERALRIAWHIVNTSVTKFVYDDERMALTGFNQAAHLELQSDPGWVTYR